ncbi:N-acetyldiaminopimelate deacetylase [Carnobacterium gallinarum]|uniref:N-acetyldiaminopimelate deacetylase n=1 Tax=Carnobacterium gallinarum TaxID=2749 RepID=UPI00055475D1|nr:N-acetyldiaminopimelate deacetylase [Carnobacterium gallinarum]
MTELNPFVAIRRELHLIPEIGLEEYKTHDYLLNKINALPQEHLEIKTWKTAIVVRVKGSEGEKTIGWRTDIDGLPVSEETDLPFKSTHEGRMHACGHDMHMSIALGLLTHFSQHPGKNDLVILFQPAEENECGGKLVYDHGLLDEWMPQEFYALHVQPELPVGTIGTRAGTLFAGTCRIKADFTGKSGHAAYPHESNDMIVAASQFVSQLQTIVSRSVNPVEGAVITIGTFNAGTTENIISGNASLTGTIRTLTPEMSEHMIERVQQVAAGIEASYQCKIELSLVQGGYLPVVNAEKETTEFIEFMNHHSAVDLVISPTAMIGEDFGYLLNKVPGTMFWLGVDSPYGLHHPKMSPKEEAIPFAIQQVGAFLEMKLAK